MSIFLCLNYTYFKNMAVWYSFVWTYPSFFNLTNIFYHLFMLGTVLMVRIEQWDTHVWRLRFSHTSTAKKKRERKNYCKRFLNLFLVHILKNGNRWIQGHELEAVWVIPPSVFLRRLWQWTIPSRKYDNACLLAISLILNTINCLWWKKHREK